MKMILNSRAGASLFLLTRRGVAAALLGAAVLYPMLAPLPAHAASPTADESLDEVRAQPALNAALNWLISLDSGNVYATWNWASTNFKKTNEPNAWAKVVAAVRTSSGKTLTRTPRTCKFLDSLDGAPPGKYCAILYLSSFDKRKQASEIVMLVAEGDKWKVCDYRIEGPALALNCGATGVGTYTETTPIDGVVPYPKDTPGSNSGSSSSSSTQTSSSQSTSQVRVTPRPVPKPMAPKMR